MADMSSTGASEPVTIGTLKSLLAESQTNIFTQLKSDIPALVNQLILGHEEIKGKETAAAARRELASRKIKSTKPAVPRQKSTPRWAAEASAAGWSEHVGTDGQPLGVRPRQVRIAQPAGPPPPPGHDDAAAQPAGPDGLEQPFAAAAGGGDDSPPPSDGGSAGFYGDGLPGKIPHYRNSNYKLPLAALESGEIDARFPRPVGRGGNELDDCIPGFDKLKPAGQHELTFLYWPTARLRDTLLAHEDGSNPLSAAHFENISTCYDILEQRVSYFEQCGLALSGHTSQTVAYWQTKSDRLIEEANRTPVRGALGAAHADDAKWLRFAESKADAAAEAARKIAARKKG